MAIIGPIQYGGLYTKNASISSPPAVGVWADIPTRQMSTCQDFNKNYSSFLARPATAQFSTTLNGANQVVNGLAWYSDANNYSQGIQIYAMCNGGLFQNAMVTNASTPLTFTARTGAISMQGTLGNPYTFDILNNILVGCGGSGSGKTPFKITAYNVNAVAFTGSPLGDCVKVVNNFLFIGRQLNAASTYSSVSWSNVGDPTTWTAANYVDFRVNDGDRVQALGSIGQDLYIFKRNSIGRLSTTTQIISGAVTLGPLQTISIGTGTLGPWALDNMPDGRIVFLASDGRLKLFDGTSFTDLSDMPYPGPNIQASFDEIAGGPNFSAICVRVFPDHHQIIVCFTGYSTGYRCYVYDWFEEFWSQWTGITPTILLNVPRLENSNVDNGAFGMASVFYEGNSIGTVVQLNKTISLYGPGNDAGTNINPSCTVNIMLGGDLSNFTPRSIIIPFTNSNSSAAQCLITTVWDGTLSGGTTYTLGASPAFSNIIVPIPFASSGTTVRPRTLQMKITGTNWGPILHPFYLSDEVLA